jgi:DNA-binding CsgD family transcriptional regulator
VLIIQGKWEEAREVWRQQHGAAPRMDVNSTIPFIAAMAGAQGERTEAWSLVQEALPAGTSTEPGTTHSYIVILQCIAARLALDDDNPERALQWLEAHDHWLAWAGPEVRWGRADGHLAWAAYYRATVNPDAALRHAESALALATEPRQPLALIAAHRLLGELATDAGWFDTAAPHLKASLSLADACQAPFERALTLLALAELRAATGDLEQARIALEEVRAVCAPLGATPTLTRVAILDERLATVSTTPAIYPAGLSAREVEVLRLLAAGKTNREIADALFLSPGTVNVHVTHILTKTNTTNRTEAALFARDHGLT